MSDEISIELEPNLKSTESHNRLIIVIAIFVFSVIMCVIVYYSYIAMNKKKVTSLTSLPHFVIDLSKKKYQNSIKMH